MAWYDRLLNAGRRRKEPARDSAIYPRLMNIGGLQYSRDRPMVKPTPANLRRFSKTTYARRAIKSVKDPIASLSWEIAPKSGIDINPELQRQIDLLTPCFDQPNRDDSFSTLIEQVVEDLLVCGQGCIEHQVGADQTRPLWMWPVDGLSIQVFAGWDGDNASPRYWQAIGYNNVGGQQGVPLRNDELVMIKTDPTNENPFGLGAIEVAFGAINNLMGAQLYAGKVASNASPENLLFFAGLSSEELDRLRAYWRNEVEGQGLVPLFANDDKQSAPQAVKLRGGNDEALFLKFQEVLIREIFAAVGVSPQNAGIEKDVNRNTAEVSEDRDWRMVIVPTAKRCAEYINREIVSGQFGFTQVEFKFVGLDREDEKAAAEIYNIRYKANMITPNEERGRLNMPPLDNPFADMLAADVEIATAAARSAAVVDDPNLSSQPAAAPARRSKD
jgi:hypothetical protein